MQPPSARPDRPVGAAAVPASVPAAVARAAEECPDREALIGRGTRLTYRQLAEAVDAASLRLAEAGAAPGVQVAASGDNDVALVVAFLATMRVGATWVGVNRRLASPEKAFILEDASVSILVAPDETLAELAPDRFDLPRLTRRLVLGDLAATRHPAHDGPGVGVGVGVGVGAPRANALVDIAHLDPHAPAAVAYTSGTTGHPKGVIHSQYNLLLPGAYLASTDDYRPGVRIGVCMPITILNLLVLGPLLGIQARASTVLLDRIDADGLVEWVQTEGIESMAVPPATLYDLTRRPQTADRIASWRWVQTGGGDCPDSLLAEFEQGTSTHVTRSYGLTEVPTLVSVELDGAPHRSGSSGPPMPYLCVQVVGEDGEELPQGQVGELCVKAATDGPWADLWTPMLGYLHHPDATAEVLRDGVLHTGDMGLLDDEGLIHIADRRTNVIVRGGANVYPAEVERVLQAHPQVAASAVVGRPDERLGRRVVAFVEAVQDGALDVENLRVHCAAQLARYKVPEQFVVLPTLPRNAMGKVAKTELDGIPDGGGDPEPAPGPR